MCGSGNLHVSEWYRKAGNYLDWPGMRLPYIFLFFCSLENCGIFLPIYVWVEVIICDACTGTIRMKGPSPRGYPTGKLGPEDGSRTREAHGYVCRLDRGCGRSGLGPVIIEYGCLSFKLKFCYVFSGCPEFHISK